MTSSFHSTANGTNIHYIRIGTDEKPLLLLLHGLGGSNATFTPILEDLPKDRYQILSVDLEGHGRTKLTDRDAALSIQRYVSDLEHLIFAKSPKGESNKTVLIGHSLGSIIALHYAARNPGSIAGLGLLGVGRSASHIPEARQRMLGLASKARSEGMAAVADIAVGSNLPAGTYPTPQQQEEVRSAVASTNGESYARTCEALSSLEHRDPDYEKIKCPVVFISGSSDFLSPVDRAEGLKKTIGGRSMVKVVQSGHQPIIQAPEAVKDGLTDMFEMIR